MGDDSRALDRASRGVEPDHVRSPDQLVQLAVVDHRARIEVGYLGGDRARPTGGVP